MAPVDTYYMRIDGQYLERTEPRYKEELDNIRCGAVNALFLHIQLAKSWPWFAWPSLVDIGGSWENVVIATLRHSVSAWHIQGQMHGGNLWSVQG